jgi:hypothetical protein
MTKDRRRVWSEKVDRAQRRHAKAYADASHDFIERDAASRAEGEPAPWLNGQQPTETEAQAMREYLNTLGRLSGAGEYPG